VPEILVGPTNLCFWETPDDGILVPKHEEVGTSHEVCFVILL
jgi:hypothetical protein